MVPRAFGLKGISRARFTSFKVQPYGAIQLRRFYSWRANPSKADFEKFLTTADIFEYSTAFQRN